MPSVDAVNRNKYISLVASGISRDQGTELAPLSAALQIVFLWILG